ncbi:hypothetical protein HI914_04563 [Erysiphe necator]|nr:hypothetical protein HI914_04563 [Erysiphe necator]
MSDLLLIGLILLQCNSCVSIKLPSLFFEILDPLNLIELVFVRNSTGLALKFAFCRCFSSCNANFSSHRIKVSSVWSPIIPKPSLSLRAGAEISRQESNVEASIFRLFSICLWYV